jgi:DNA-binding transcriptional LysR family regulator
MDRFAALSAFVSVAELKSFAAAARRLGQSPSAITRLVGALEAHMGVRLLNRTTRAVSLTDAGERFLHRSQKILADLAEAERMAESERGEPAGRLVVTAPLVFGRLHVAPLICAFMNRHPKVLGELQLGDRMVNLVDEGIDVAVRIGALADSADIVRRVGTTRRVLVAAPGYLKQRGMPLKPAELAEHRLIAFSPITAPHLWHFHQGGRSFAIETKPAYITNSADAAIWHAAQGGGLTFALSYQVMDHLRAGALRIVLQEFEPEPLPIQFVYPSSRFLSLKVRALIDMAVATVDWSFVDLPDGTRGLRQRRAKSRKRVGRVS